MSRQNPDNPLLDFDSLPQFNRIKPQHVEPALDTILQRNRDHIKFLVNMNEPASWDNFMQPMEALSDQLDRMWAPVSHLNSVKDSEALRKAYEACLAKLTDYASEIGQHKGIFSRISQIHEAGDFARMDPARRKAIDDELLDFRLSGVDLDLKEQARFREISSRLSDLSNRFSRNLLDATDAWTLHVEHQHQLSGLPEGVKQQARTQAEQQGRSGWIFTLQGPSYLPFMTYAEDRDLREQMYRAYATRASEIGPHGGQWDNSGLICEILALRREQAELLGYSDYANCAMETRMAKSTDQVRSFLVDLANSSRVAAQRELETLQDFAQREYGLEDLQAWDMAYMSEALKQRQFDFSSEALRPYFPLPQVLDGMFKIVGRLFGIQISRLDLAQSWHSTVELYQVRDQHDALRGHFYTDLYSRNGKRSGAWMAECIGRRKSNGEVQNPVAFLTCNFPEPLADQPSLLSHDEVTTLFHEFGHTLHHLLTKVDVAAVAGINGVPWDAVEMPSQFLENWCWEKESLDLICGHYQTGAKIPGRLLEKMQSARNFQSAMQMLRQVEFSLFDLELHCADAPVATPQDVRSVLEQVRAQVSVVNTPEFNRFENSFGHIFAGGYAAGYYSYKWAEVLSADAFGRFEEQGIFDSGIGASFLENILEKGGSQDPADLFRAFRGRDPQIEALMRQSGLAE